MFNAILADVPVSVESRTWAQQTKVMYGLHHGHFTGKCGIVDRRTNEIQRVVNVNDVYMLLFDDFLDFSVGFWVENRGERKQEFLGF